MQDGLLKLLSKLYITSGRRLPDVYLVLSYGCSSTGRATVSKTVGCGFKSCRPCKFLAMDKLRVLFKEYTDELLYKVQWPSLEELQSSTVTVLVASLIIAILIFVMDFVFSRGMGGLYAIFLG